MSTPKAQPERGQGIAVIVAQGRAPGLVRTVDTLIRQTTPPSAASIAAVESDRAEILQSVEQRTGAAVVISANLSRAVNTAVSNAASDWVLLVPSGVRLRPRAIERCAAALCENAGIVAVAPAIRDETPDGLRGQVRSFPDLGPVSLLEEPTCAPPVLCIRRTGWDQVGGLDEACDALAVLDLLLRLLRVGRLAGLADVLALRDISDSSDWTQVWPAHDPYVRHLAHVIEKNRPVIEPVMRELLLRRETRLVALRDGHRDLVRRRDDDLSRLDAVRAEIAHARAYLRHHGQDVIDWGEFRRIDPISRNWGYERGVPIDRYYIEAFLAAHSSDIRGAVLEVQENDYTTKFGGSRVESSSVVDLDEANPRATHLADLRCAPHMASDSFDCIILTQTLHVIDDVDAVLNECRRLLKPDGVMLTTLPCASRVCLEYGTDGDLWRMTPAGGRALFEKTFGAGVVESSTYGNVLSNMAFLEGLGISDLTPQEFDVVDPYFPALVGIRARKHNAARDDRSRGRAILLYHRVADDEDVHGLSVSRQRFDEHVRMLARDYRVIPLDELLRTPAGDLPPRAVALTFDDGYLDNLVEAAPVLERAGLPATFFLTSGWLSGPGEYWWDTLERVLLLNDSVPPSIILSGPDQLRLSAGTAEQRLASHDQLHALMVSAPLEVRDRLTAELSRLGGPPARRRPLVADEVLQLARIAGMSVGAHTVNHLSLPHQDSAVVARELDDCRTTLEDVTGTTINAFAYPYGAASRACVDPVRSRFQWGLTCDEAEIGSSFDAARAGRIEVRNWTAGQLSERLDRVFAASER